MLLRQHRAATARVTPRLRHRIFAYFGLPPFTGNVCDVLSDHGFWQADLVLCLLRVNDEESLRLVTKLVGHPIVVCPPCLRHAHRLPPPRALARHEVRVTWVSPKITEALTGDLARRTACLRPGMMLSQYRARGGRRRDLRLALSRGLIRVEKAA